MRDNETPDEMYQRILALGTTLTEFGCKDNGDDYVKHMFITAFNPKEPIEIIRSRPYIKSMTSNEVLCKFIALTILKNNAEETRARVLVGQGAHNLALKAKVVRKQEEEVCEGEYWSLEDAKYALNEHLALTTNAFWDANKHKFKWSKFKSSPRGDRKGSDSKVRHCYNCGGIKHFIAECPYENKEDHDGWLIPKRRSSKFSSIQEARKQGRQEERAKVVGGP
jgi:hypothetical protein